MFWPATCHSGNENSVFAVLDEAKAAVMLGTDRAHVLREAIMCCRKGGTVSVPGVYVGLLDKIPFGAAMNKGLTIKTGQTPVEEGASQAYKAVPRQERRLHQGGSQPVK